MEYLGNGYYEINIDGTYHRVAFEIANFKGGKAWRREVQPGQMNAVARLVKAAFKQQGPQFLGAAAKGISVKEMSDGGAPTKLDVWGPGGTTQAEDETTKWAMGLIINMLKNNPIGKDSLTPRRLRMRRSGSTSSLSGSMTPPGARLRGRHPSRSLSKSSDGEDNSASRSSSPVMSRKRLGKMRKGTSVNDLVDELEEERGELELQVETLTKEKRELEKKLRNLEEHNVELEEDNEELEVLRQQNAQLVQRVKERNARLDELGEEVERLTKANEIAKKQLEDQAERVVHKNKVGGTLVAETGAKNLAPRVRLQEVRIVEQLAPAANIPVHAGKKAPQPRLVGHAEIDYTLVLEEENADLRSENEKMAAQIDRLKEERLKEVAVAASIPVVIERTRRVIPAVSTDSGRALVHGIDGAELVEAHGGKSASAVAAPVIVERDEPVAIVDNSEEIARLKDRIEELERELYNGFDGDAESFDDEIIEDPRAAEIEWLGKRLDELIDENKMLVDEKAAVMQENAAFTFALRRAEGELEKTKSALAKEKLGHMEAKDDRNLVHVGASIQTEKINTLEQALQRQKNELRCLRNQLVEAKEWEGEARTFEESALDARRKLEEERLKVQALVRKVELLETKLEGFLVENASLHKSVMDN